VVRPTYKSLAEMQAAATAATAIRAPQPCLVGPWRWQTMPFGRQHTQTGAVEPFPTVVAGVSMETVQALVRHGQAVYILTPYALVRVPVATGP
jgi:hypothetical protein